MLTNEATTTTEGQVTESNAAATTDAQAPAATDANQQQADAATTDSKAQAEGKDNTQDDAGKADKAGAPEQYEFKAPEGQKFDDLVIAEFTEVARELDLPQDAAQKILDKVAPVIQARQTEQINAARTAWGEATRTDKEFGGDKLNENLAVAKKALDKFGSPELRVLLNESGLGNHPEVIRMMYRAGKAIGEDTFVGGKQTGATPSQSAAKALYPSQQT